MNTRLEDLPDLLTVEEVSEIARVRPTTVYRWRTDGGGPKAIKLGGNLRYRKRDVLAWIDAGSKNEVA